VAHRELQFTTAPGWRRPARGYSTGESGAGPGSTTSRWGIRTAPTFTPPTRRELEFRSETEGVWQVGDVLECAPLQGQREITRRSDAEEENSLRFLRRSGFLALALLASMGCASTQMSDREAYTGGKLPKPGRIIVDDFVVSPDDLPTWAEAQLEVEPATKPMTPDELEAGRALGASVAEELVAKIDAMGLNAVRSTGQAAPVQNDLVMIGYFTSIDKGSAAERVVVGFGKGDASLSTHVAAYRMNAGSLEKLGSGTTTTSGGKGPGVILPAVVTIATANPIGLAVGGAIKAEGEISGRGTIKGSGKQTADKIAQVLEMRFREQGWIQ